MQVEQRLRRLDTIAGGPGQSCCSPGSTRGALEEEYFEIPCGQSGDCGFPAMGARPEAICSGAGASRASRAGIPPGPIFAAPGLLRSAAVPVVATATRLGNGPRDEAIGVLGACPGGARRCAALTATGGAGRSTLPATHRCHLMTAAVLVGDYSTGRCAANVGLRRSGLCGGVARSGLAGRSRIHVGAIARHRTCCHTAVATNANACVRPLTAADARIRELAEVPN